MKRGEIRWYKFPKPDKKRPILILTRDSTLEFLGEVTVAPITSIVRSLPPEVFLSKSDGMQKDCAVNVDHIQTVSKGRIGSLITVLSPKKMIELRSALFFALGFSESSSDRLT
jgi:mRNA interferase MazF